MTTDLQAENLAEAVLKTFAFFDTFNYPLTVFEAWRLCEVKTEFLEISKVLNENYLASRLTQKNGFYFLIGRENLVEERRKFALLSEQKMQRARLAVRLWRFVPGLKGVALCNNFYYRPESDIDLLVITAKNSLWLTRFLTIAITQLIGLRINNKKTADQICLSFFVSEDGLDLSPLMMPDSDPYFIYWFAFLDPLFDDGVFTKFWNENLNIRRKLPNANLPTEAPFRVLARKSHWLAPVFFDNCVRPWQKKVISRKKINPDNEPTGVVSSETVLKSHEQDRRREFRHRFEENLKKHL
ncbi:MAG: hypothetical protein ACOYMB_02980 [Patescibacteria group bacterium]